MLISEERCRGSTFFNLSLPLGELSVCLIKSLPGKSLRGLKMRVYEHETETQKTS